MFPVSTFPVSKGKYVSCGKPPVSKELPVSMFPVSKGTFPVSKLLVGMGVSFLGQASCKVWASFL